MTQEIDIFGEPISKDFYKKLSTKLREELCNHSHQLVTLEKDLREIFFLKNPDVFPDECVGLTTDDIVKELKEYFTKRLERRDDDTVSGLSFDYINDMTGFGNGDYFKDSQSVREYFTVENMKDMFAVCFISQEDLDKMARVVILKRWWMEGNQDE